MSHLVPTGDDRLDASIRRRPLISALGVVLVMLFVVVELLLFRSYGQTDRTTRDFSEATATATTLANVQRESLLLAGMISRLEPGDSLAPIELQRGLLQRQLMRFEAEADSQGHLMRRMRAIRATLRRVDSAFAAAYGRGSRAQVPRGARRVDQLLAQLELQVKQTFDREEQALYRALTDTLHKRAQSQQLLVGLGGFGLLLAVALAIAIRRTIRRDFARAYAALADEVREREALQEELSHQALHDPLTDLGNRTYFQGELAHAQRDRDAVAVIYLDLDGFKEINDLLGHDAGDLLLCEVSERLVKHVRPNDRVARLGGDEFAVLLRGLRDPAVATEIAERLVAALQMPVRIAGQPTRVGVSLGIALGEGELDPDALTRNADLAMYAAKQDGRRAVRVYDPSMRTEPLAREELAADLEAALDGDELELNYQPIVDLRSDAVVGLEALVRWRHPRRGLLSPGEFLPIAEEKGLMVAIGRKVLAAACREAQGWTRLSSTQPAPWVSVNVAGEQIEEPAFIDDIAAALERSGLDPDRLVIEISERAVQDFGRPVAGAVARIRELGAHAALDDFGTGYSALSSLRFLPIDILKIDKSFVDRITAEEDGWRLAEAVFKLGEHLGLTTIAEGVEERPQLEALKRMRCPLVQGYHVSRPLPADKLLEYLAQHTSPRLRAART